MLNSTMAFRLFFKNTMLFLGIMSLCRITFLLFNINYLTSVGQMDFLQGVRFDFVTAAYGLFPFYFSMVFLFAFLRNKSFVKILNAYVLVITLLFAAMNFVDVIYFKFTLKRSTWDIFSFVSTGDDVLGLIPTFIIDFWYIFVLFFVLVVITLKFSKISDVEYSDKPLKVNLAYSVLMLVILILGARGGIQLKPLNIIDASRYTEGQNVP